MRKSKYEILRDATDNGDLETAWNALDKGAEYWGEKRPGTSADKLLVLGATYGHSHFVEAALERGADVNYVDPIYLGDALSRASGNGFFGIVQTLLENGARTELKCDFPPLHEAARSNDIDMIELLYNAGADLNFWSRGTLGTPLMVAAKQRSADAVEKLLQLGADPETVVQFYVTTQEEPVEHTVWDAFYDSVLPRGYDETLAVLEEHGIGPGRTHPEP